MRCAYCEGEITTKTSRRRFYSDKCRAAAWQRQRKDGLALVEEQFARALSRVRTLRGSVAAE
jgi:hypothetical protein